MNFFYKTVRLRNVEKREQTVVLTGHTYYYVFSVAFSPDGALFASCSGEKTVRLRLWSLWTPIQKQLQCVALPLLQHNRVPAYVLLRVVDKMLALQGHQGDLFRAKKIDWIAKLKRLL